MSSFLTAPEIAAPAFRWIWGFVYPCEFGADLVERRVCAWHDHPSDLIAFCPDEVSCGFVVLVHTTSKTIPAVASGLTDHVSRLQELLGF